MGNHQQDEETVESRQGAMMDRTRIVHDLFSAINAPDLDSERARSTAMRKFAIWNGFEGTDEEWTQEFATLCEEWKCQPGEGFNKATFMEFVSDDSEKGCFRSDQELQNLLEKVLAGLPAENAEASLTP